MIRLKNYFLNEMDLTGIKWLDYFIVAGSFLIIGGLFLLVFILYLYFLWPVVLFLACGWVCFKVISDYIWRGE